MNIKNEKRNRKYGSKKGELIELAAEKLAEIFVAQIEFQRNKNKNSYEKRR